MGKKKTDNIFLQNQIVNMLSTLEVFENSCKLAAEQDDGKIDREEAAVLKVLNRATEKYRQELKAIEFEETEQ